MRSKDWPAAVSVLRTTLIRANAGPVSGFWSMPRAKQREIQSCQQKLRLDWIDLRYALNQPTRIEQIPLCGDTLSQMGQIQLRKKRLRPDRIYGIERLNEISFL